MIKEIVVIRIGGKTDDKKDGVLLYRDIRVTFNMVSVLDVIFVR